MARHSSAIEVISAQTDRTGFLHLPNEIRNRIYEEALFQHDREAIFLPRKLPRKVLDDGFKICDAFMDAENSSVRTQILWSERANFELTPDVHDDCKWVEEERQPEEIPLPIFTEEETDDETETDVRNRSLSSYNRWSSAWLGARSNADSAKYIDATDMCKDCNLVYCTCINAGSPSQEEAYDAIVAAQELESDNNFELEDVLCEEDDDNDEDEYDEEERYDSDGYLIPPSICFKGHGIDDRNSVFDMECRFCGGFGFGSDQEEEAYIDDTLDDDDPLKEDDEHFDSEERIGMLFHTFEPSILRACKEIREQCLPIYYGSNAFSWRFFWGDQTRSLARFTEWNNVVGKNAKYITQVSFEGRHLVEEGIEFEVDIDLLEESPFFEVAADCMHPGDELTDAIVEAIEQDFVTILWRMSKRDSGVIKLSSKDLGLLGTIFSDVLQRDPGTAGDRGQWDGKYAVVPRHA